LHEDALDAGILFERLLDLLGLDGGTVGLFDDNGFETEASMAPEPEEANSATWLSLP